MIKSIEVKNFKIYKNAYVEIPDGLFVITGKNRTGKTSMLEALEFGLTGEVKGIKTNGELFDKFATIGSSQMMVIVSTDKWGDLKRVLTKNGDKCTSTIEFLGETGKSAESMIKECFNLSFLTFGFNELLNKNGRERKEIVMKHIGANEVEFDSFKEYVKEKLGRSDFEEKCMPFLTPFKALGEDLVDKTLESLDKEFKSLNSQIKTDKGSVETLAKLKSELDVNLNKLPVLEQDILTIDNELADLKETLSKFNFEKNSIESDGLEAEKLRDWLKLKKTEFKDLETLKLEQLENLESMRVQITNDESEIFSLDEQIASISAEMIEAKANLKSETIAAYKRTIYSYEETMGEIQESKSDFEITSLCPITKQPCSADKDRIVSSLTADIETVKLERDRLDELVKNLIDEDAKTMVTVQSYEETLNHLGTTRRTLVNNLSELKSKFNTLQINLARTAEKLSSVVEMISNYENAISNLEKKSYPSSNVDADAVANQIQTLEETKKDKRDQIDAIKQKKYTYQKQVETQNELDERQERFEIVKSLRDAIGIHGYQGEFIFGKLNDMKDRINAIVQSVFPEEEFYFEAKDKEFNFGFSQKPFESLSGFEQIVLSLAMTKEMTSGSAYPLLVFDEIGRIFHDSLDDFVKLLETFEGYQIIVTGAVDENLLSATCYNVSRVI